MYRVVLKKEVKKFLNKHQELIPKFVDSVNKLAHNPFDKSLDIKPLTWRKNLSEWRLRIWKYRFVYEVLKEEVIILFFDAWSRGKIYK